jgi:hypothetical protein
MKKLITLIAFALVSNSAFALDQPPAPILNGAALQLDQVTLVERFTQGNGEIASMHTIDVVVSGMFTMTCGGLQTIVKFERLDARTNQHDYQVSGAFSPIRCLAISIPVRKTFVLDSLFLQANDQVPFVTVNGIRAIRAGTR